MERELKPGSLTRGARGETLLYPMLVLALVLTIFILPIFDPKEAHAQVPAEAKKFMLEAGNRTTVEKAFRLMATSLMPSCRSINTDGKFNAKIYVPFEFSSDGNSLVKGAWKEEALFDICGTKRQLNILSVATSQGVQRRMLLPGTSIGDPVLQRDGLLYAQVGASPKVAPDCKARVVDTKFMSFEPPNSTGKKPWHEIWTVDACGHDVPVEITFIPDATGTTISSKLR